MAEALPLSENELKLLASLVRHRVRFMIVGLSAAALQGAPVVTENVDLWFEDLSDPKLSLTLRAVGAAYLPPFDLNPPMLGGPGSEPAANGKLIAPELNRGAWRRQPRGTRSIARRSA